MKEIKIYHSEQALGLVKEFIQETADNMKYCLQSSYKSNEDLVNNKLKTTKMADDFLIETEKYFKIYTDNLLALKAYKLNFTKNDKLKDKVVFSKNKSFVRPYLTLEELSLVLNSTLNTPSVLINVISDKTWQNIELNGVYSISKNRNNLLVPEANRGRKHTGKKPDNVKLEIYAKTLKLLSEKQNMSLKKAVYEASKLVRKSDSCEKLQSRDYQSFLISKKMILNHEWDTYFQNWGLDILTILENYELSKVKY